MGVIIRQGVKSTIVNYIGAAIGAFTTLFLVTKYLPKEDIGLLAVIFEVGLLFSSLAILGTSSSIMRFFPYFRDKEKKHNGFFFYIIMLPFIGCLIFIPLYIFLKEPVTKLFIEESPIFISYYYWVIPLIFFLTYWSVFESYSNANMRITVPKFIKEILVRLLLIAVYVLFIYQVLDRDGLVGSYIAVYGIAMLVTLIYVSRIAPTSLKHDKSFITPSLKKDISRYTLYLLIGALGSNLLGGLSTFIISSEMGLDYTGVYKIVFYIAIFVEIPARSITAISSPVAATALRHNNINEAEQLYKKVSLHQLLAGGLLFVLIWSNIDNIFQIMPNGGEYALGKWVVLFIGIAKLIEISLSFGGILISFSKYYYWSLYFVFIILGIGIGTNYLLIPAFGITGSAIATLISSILIYSFQQFIVLRKLKCSPYSLGTLKALAVILVLFGINFILPDINNPWLDTLYRSAILALIALPAVYFLKISPEVNNIVLMVFQKIGIIKK